jgi:HEAT repeat protein
MPLPIEETITELANSDQPLLNSRLTELSNLSPEELQIFKGSWTAIEAKRRCQIVYWLVELTEENLILNFDNIFRYCLRDKDSEVRQKAIEGLWENEDASLINPLIDLLEQDSSEKVQAASATALGKFVILAEHKKLRSCHLIRIQEALLPVISDEHEPIELRRRALEAIAPVCLPQVRTAIMKAYQSPDSSFKISAVYAMGKNCDHSWLPILLKELANANAEVRYEAAGACGELEEEEAVPYLIKLVNDSDVDVQMAAIQALSKIGSTQAKECLEACLNNASEAIRQTAEQALSELEMKPGPLSFQF